ncbi:MarR family winged helix-turn-helix transcriptional regulator [Streptomyces sp. NPDC048385]|uniref:MarR family winged helix-turn-helix transcriptional regulator n=1 Tax=unclassified Streptomyces TaxID=2593676 RepID=UPI0034285CDD
MNEYDTAPPDTDPADVGLHFLAVAYRTRSAVDQHMAAAGLSLSRTKLLQSLARNGAMHQAELAEELGQAPRSVTQTIEALERLHLVTRATDPADRRRKAVTLTDKGKAALAAGEQAGRAALQHAFSAFDTGQLADLKRLLDRMCTFTDAPIPHDAATPRRQLNSP